MSNVSAAIRRFINQNLRLSQSDIAKSAKSREWVLGRLANTIAARTADPVLFAEKPFVNFGSYFKYTKMSVVDEYDVLVVIDSKSGQFSSSGAVVGRGLGSADPNRKYEQRFYKGDGSGVSPHKILEWLRDAASEALEPYGCDPPIRDGQAITVRIKSSDVAIDLVPAGVFERDSDGMRFYNIPSGSPDDEWILTAPRTDAERLQRVADGRPEFRNVIRIAKWLVWRYGLVVTSFAVETAVVEVGEQNKWSDTLSIDVPRVFLGLAGIFSKGFLADPFDSSKNLLGDLTAVQLNAAYTVFFEVAGVLLDLHDRTDDLTDEEMYQRVVAAFGNH